MVSRISTIFWMILIVAAALGLYVVKYQVQSMQEELAKQENILRDEREALHVLEAEWAYLNKPQRLQQLAEKYLATTPTLSKQISSIDMIPKTSDLMTASVNNTKEVDKEDGLITPVKATSNAR
jgi:hypothetical protein